MIEGDYTITALQKNAGTLAVGTLAANESRRIASFVKLSNMGKTALAAKVMFKSKLRSWTDYTHIAANSTETFGGRRDDRVYIFDNGGTIKVAVPKSRNPKGTLAVAMTIHPE